MLRRYNRLLVACYVVADARRPRSRPSLLAYFIRFERPFAEVVPITKAQPPFSQYLHARCRSSRCSCRSRSSVQGLYRLRRGRTRVDDFFAVLVGSCSPCSPASSARCTSQAYHLSARSRTRATSSLARRLGALPGAERALHVHLARGRARPAAAPLARRHRPEARADRRRRRSRPDGRGPHPRAQRAGLQARRLRGRPRRVGRRDRLPRPAAARHDRSDRRRSARTSRSTRSTSRCRSTST